MVKFAYDPRFMNLSTVLFWDTDYNQIDWDSKARYVIERVVMYGTVGDWRVIQEYYGMDRIRDEMLQSHNPDAKTLLQVARSFTYFDDAEEDEEPALLKPCTWSLVKDTIWEEVKNRFTEYS